MTLILGLETSCDETAAAVVEDGCRVQSNIVASQHELHERYHGVVPEIASRAHVEQLVPVLRQALAQAGADLEDLDAIAVANRPGLIGSLLVGVSGAQALAWATGKPLIGVDHVHAHLHATSLRAPHSDGRAEGQDRADADIPLLQGQPRYPALGLVISGGHTSLFELRSPTDLMLLGRTIDDAVGEAYDKAAVILQLGYPGGPQLDQLAQTGDSSGHRLPRSRLGRDSLDFSFSGLKTALLYRVRGQPRGRGPAARFDRSADDLEPQQRADLAAAFQAAAIDSLMLKLERAIDQLSNRGNPPGGLVIGGGVSANSLLRRRVVEMGQHRNLPVHLPALTFCLDNAAMIAGLAYEHYRAGRFDPLDLPAIATTAW